MAPNRQATPNILDDLMSAAPAGASKPTATTLRIAEIRRDGGTQPRAGLDEAHVQDLVAAIAAGDELPPVDVVFDGTAYWLYDGYHRTEATSRSGKYTVQAIIHQGTQQDAQWMSYAANSRHGLKRTNDDKRRQVIAALRHPNGASMSNREIARHVGVDESTVRDHRAKLEAAAGIPQVTERKGADGKVYDTAKIGTNRPQPKRDDAAEDAWTAKHEQPAAVKWATIWELEQHVRDCAAEFYAQETPAYAAQDMRAAARVRDGGFWRRCERTPASIVAWRPNDMVQAINNQANRTFGRPLVEVIKTDDELAAAAQAADIASRNAAADEAARQAQAAAAADEAARQAQAAAATDVAFGMAPPRHAELVRILDAAMEALPEIGDMITQRQYCLSVVTTLGIMKKELLAAIAKTSAPTAELPAELVAAGWELHTMRGKHYAAVSVPTEEEPIRTQLRADIADTIRDAQYMHKSLRIGA